MKTMPPDIFSVIINRIEDGMTISEACVDIGYDRNKMYHLLTPTQKMELYMAKMSNSIQGNVDAIFQIGKPDKTFEPVEWRERNDIHNFFKQRLGSEDNPFAWENNLETFQISPNT